MPALSAPGVQQYRAEIDGLRAIAVMAVVMSHAKLGVSGGFVGVDVFFVISGFLITSIIWRDLENNCFSFAHFWERRARRIVPALTVITLAVLGMGWFMFLPHDLKGLGASAAVQAMFVANFYYLLTINYFAADSSLLPLLHTWSLAVEEQFYLIAPFVLVLLHRCSGTRRMGIVLTLLIVGMLASLATSVVLLKWLPSATFYLLPTRAWELLLGSAIALFPAQWTPRHPLTRESASVLGLAGVVLPCFIYDGHTPFPGLAALPPCAGTGLFIWANSRISRNPSSTGIGRMLGSKPIAFIGSISYSLYLWHWPVLVFYTYFYADLGSTFESLGSIGNRLGLVALSFLLAILSWIFVETPFRDRRLCTGRTSLLLCSAMALVLVLGIGATIYQWDGIPSRLPIELTAGDATPDSFARDVCIDDIREDHLIEIGAPDASITVLIWGDSFAKVTLTCFDDYLKSKGMAGRAVSHSATPPVLGPFYSTDPHSLQREIREQNEAVFEYIKNNRIEHVVLLANWRGYGPEREYPLDYDSISIEEALSVTVKRLVDAGVRPWLIVQIPIPDFDVPRALAQRYFGRDITAYYRKADSRPALAQNAEETVEWLRAQGCRILDPGPYFLDPTRQFYMIEQDGIPLFFDWGHVTARGALLLVDMLRDNRFLE